MTIKDFVVLTGENVAEWSAGVLAQNFRLGKIEHARIIRRLTRQTFYAWTI
ncbi:hypothetical protein AAC03nite_31270 [Alicyclobacillus acidoterrestris]|nr:hypothetical protein AAC03nite_31270 [Alicyclobacillus acidoterrestris]